MIPDNKNNIQNDLSALLILNRIIFEVKMFTTLDDETVRKVIDGQVNYDDMPIDDRENEILKGYFFKDQAAFVAEYGDENPLCCVTESACLKEKCQLYATRLQPKPICREYKMYFKGASHRDMIRYVEQEFERAMERVKAEQEQKQKATSLKEFAQQ